MGAEKMKETKVLKGDSVFTFILMILVNGFDCGITILGGNNITEISNA